MEERDYLLLYQLRSSADARFLRPIDPDPLSQLHYVLAAREKAIRGEELYYAVANITTPEQPQGFIRLADVKSGARFSFHSLIFFPGADPRLPIDALFTVQRIGFENLGKQICDGLAVHPDHLKMLKIHRTMGIALESGRDSNWVYLTATRENYMSRRAFFLRAGFGVMSIGGST